MDYIFLGAKNPEIGRMIVACQRSEANFRVRGFLDNDPTRHGSFVGYPVFGGFESLTAEMIRECHFVNLIRGTTRARFETSLFFAERGCRFANLIHPSVDLTMTSLGVGNYVHENAVIQASACIGNNSCIDVAARVSHDTTIGNSVFIAHGASISGEVVIEDGVLIGTNAVIIPQIRIGKWATVGAGAVVFRDVPPYATVVGNPAKVMGIANSELNSGNPFVNI